MVVAVFWAVLVCFFSVNCISRKYFYPLSYKEIICKYADEYRLDRELVFSVVKVESGFDKNAVSSAGAMGLMQITEKTGAYIAERLCVTKYDLFDAENNLRFGCYYLRYLISRFEVLETALCAYNAGEGRVDEWLDDTAYSSDGKTLNLIPFKETQEYIVKIKKTFSKYKKLYGNILDK